MEFVRRFQAWRDRRRTARQIKRMVRAASKATVELQRFVKATERLGAAVRERPARLASRRNGDKPW